MKHRLLIVVPLIVSGACGLKIIDGSPWDYDVMNVRFTLGASLQ